VRALVESDVWRALRHGIAARWEPRQNFWFTRFCRLPTQQAALAGPVVDFLAPAGVERELVSINIGCSVGGQPYTCASALHNRRPGLRFSIHGYDIDPALIARARAARYAPRDVFATATIPPDFVAETFDRDGDDYVVKPAIAAHVRFDVADVLDPRLAAQVGTADIVRCENLLINLPRRVVPRAFANLLTLLRPRAVLFLDGMELGLRATLTRAAGLTPLDWKIAEIYEEARALHGYAYPWHYWGLEPFNGSRPDWCERYATVFLRGA
jgi:chemotaxis methyl-accepting protein methylase